MFDSKDIEKYRETKAPEGLFERILADAHEPKRARVIGKGAFVRSASAIAACFIMVVTFSFLFGSGSSDVYINVSGERLDRAGESVSVGEMPMPMALARLTDEPLGISFKVGAKGAVTVTLEGGELWKENEGEGEKCVLPYVAEAGEMLYLVPNMAQTTRLTLTAQGESVTYTVGAGEDPADIRIRFEK